MVLNYKEHKMDNRKLLLELINAKSEEEVLQIITKHSILSKDENRRPYGDD